MYSVVIYSPLSCFILATLLFHFAVQQPLSYVRQLLCIFHVLGMAIFFGADSLRLIPYSRGWIPIVLGLTLHTTSILIVDRTLVLPGPKYLPQQLKTTFRIWTNFRRLPLVAGDTSAPSHDGKNRTAFAIRKCCRILALYFAHHLVTLFVSETLRQLHIMLWDFAPSKQKLLPAIIRRDLILRAIMSVQWIWSTYLVLTVPHELLSIFHVSILRWDLPSQWPPLFGSITDAYSLRRFWGVFWHRLHVATYQAYMPSFLLHYYEQKYLSEEQKHSPGYRTAKKAFRALWMFLCSAMCHAIVNWVALRRTNIRQEMKFFLSNYALCLVETILGRIFGGVMVLKGSILKRLLGYSWVMFVFFTIVPAWQYSLVYPAEGF
jgi:hypothetical protein